MNAFLTDQELLKLQTAATRERNEYVKSLQERRRSNAAGAHSDRRLKRTRNRGEAQRKAIKEFSA